MSVETLCAVLSGLGRPNLLRETKISGANGDTGKNAMQHFFCSADHEQDWQPYSVDPYFASSYICANNLLFFVLVVYEYTATCSTVLFSIRFVFEEKSERA